MKQILLLLALALVFSIGYSQKPEMVPVEGGEFYLGNDNSEDLDDKPEHKVTISDFRMSKKEVTFDMFDNFCRATGYPFPDDGGFGRGSKPVINVSWIGAVKYCNWLSARNGLDKVYDLQIDSTGTNVTAVHWDANGYRLPTEAEWEFAAKGGSNPKGYLYTGSNDPNEVAWYTVNSKNESQDVGTKKANELGIFDLLGNAWEWCWDYYSPSYYKSSPSNDPHGPDSGQKRVYRGGCFKSSIDQLRITKRFYFDENLKNGTIGIRLVQSGLSND